MSIVKVTNKKRLQLAFIEWLSRLPINRKLMQIGGNRNEESYCTIIHEKGYSSFSLRTFALFIIHPVLC